MARKPPRWKAALGLLWSVATAWLLWVAANILGFLQGFELGRSLGLVVGGDSGGSIGGNGILAVSPLGSAVFGVPVFVLVFAGVVTMMQCLALLVMTDTRRPLTAAGLRLVLGLVALLALDLAVSMVSFRMWLLSRPLALGVIQAILLWLLLLYARRLVVDADAERLRSAWKTGGWVLLATLAAAVYGAFDEPWLGGDYCVRCGGVLSGVLGAQIGAITGIPLTYLAMRAQRSA